MCGNNPSSNPTINTYPYSSPFTECTVIKLTLLGSLSYSLTSVTRLTSSKKSSKDTIPALSSNVLVIVFNSSKFSSLISDSSVFSLSYSDLIPVTSRILSTNSVKVKVSLWFFNDSIISLNANSLPDEITS